MSAEMLPSPWCAQARQALRAVVDPELGVNIVDLGLVETIEVPQDGLLVLRMTLTSAACPMGDVILEDIDTALEALLPASWQWEIDLVFDPPWTPARMTPEARARLGWGAEGPA